ncbi:unnamed protein product [Rotaria socialis]|uniref:F-box domain-containing protein n=2 Tax=Rotaria socialis TaxID=392032 RepID=A0A818JAX2_9BILA|nr:unnamed protein product [Rotaria socialis]
MTQHNVRILDLPDEILLLVLTKLDNIDVLYSLLGINNRRLDVIVQEKIFTDVLSFVSISNLTEEISPISALALNRFRNGILPRIHKNVKSFIVESDSFECILGAATYPNLTQLKIFNLNKAFISRYFMDDSPLQHIGKQQITDLILISNESNNEIEKIEYTKNVYATVFNFFKNLKHLSIVQSSIHDYPPLLLHNLSPMTFSSSTLTKLCININDFDDCLALLDGRLKDLTILTVQISSIHDFASTSHNMNDLPGLKSFSLICYDSTEGYANLVIPLLRRMSNLEELNLYIHILYGPIFVSGADLHNEILIHMSQLHKFTFYIASETIITDSTIRISESNIEKTFENGKYQQVIRMVDYFDSNTLICRAFTLPFNFHRLEHIGNNIPNIIFNSVTYLKLCDANPFKHEFFVRLAKAFPFLKSLSIDNLCPPFLKAKEPYHRDKDWCSLVQYPYLISLDIHHAAVNYVEHFLSEREIYLPRLTELKVFYEDLAIVTHNFTRDETRRNCAQVKKLIIEHCTFYPEALYAYFPLLSY